MEPDQPTKKKQPKKIPNIIENDILLTADDDKANAFGRKLEKTFNDTIDHEQPFDNNHKIYIEEYVKTYMVKCSDLSIRTYNSWRAEFCNK